MVMFTLVDMEKVNNYPLMLYLLEFSKTQGYFLF